MGAWALALLVVAVGGVLFLRALWLREGPWDLPRSDWRVFRQEHILPDGRVVDRVNSGVTHSESQGYGMLIAEAYGDRRVFNRLWDWTRHHLQTRPQDRLLSWLWQPKSPGKEEGVGDANNASDGDLLVAWALTRAARRWHHFPYQQSALEILADLRRLNVREWEGRPVLLPGVEGFVTGDALVANPSYAVFPGFREFEAAYPDSGWEKMLASSLHLAGQSRFGKWHLPPDWLRLPSDGPPEPAPAFPPLFGYNAVRVPLYLAWLDPRSDLLAPFAKFWESFQEGEKIPDTVNLLNGEFGPYAAIPGVLAIARLTMASHHRSSITVRDIAPVAPGEAYYSVCLKILVKMAIRENREAFQGAES